jgi:hypothetical protein
MIPIAEAIETGAWLKAECPNDRSWPQSSYDAVNNGAPFTFRLRVTKFSKIDLAAIDEPEKLKICSLESNMWKLDIEVVNLCIREISSRHLGTRLVIADQDGFEYVLCSDGHLCWGSTHSGKLGLMSQDLPPKIKRIQAFAYELPDVYDQLFIRIRKGSLTEV